MWTKEFWLDAGERALKTFAQTCVAVIVAGAATTVVTVSWAAVLGTAALAAVVSLLTSVASAGVVASKDGVHTASLVKDVTYDRPLDEL